MCCVLCAACFGGRVLGVEALRSLTQLDLVPATLVWQVAIGNKLLRYGLYFFETKLVRGYGNIMPVTSQNFRHLGSESCCPW